MEVFYCLQSQLNPPFCLGLIVITMTEPKLLYIYMRTQQFKYVEALTVRSSNITLNLNGQSVILFCNFTGFVQLQFCANGTHMSLYVGCQFSMAVPISAPGVSELTAISLFAPLFSNMHSSV